MNRWRKYIVLHARSVLILPEKLIFLLSHPTVLSLAAVIQHIDLCTIDTFEFLHQRLQNGKVM